MTFQQIISRALEIRRKYSQLEKQNFKKSWAAEDLMQGCVEDVGDLSKLV